MVATYNNPPMNYFCAEGAQEFNKLIEEWRKPKYTAVIMTGAIGASASTAWMLSANGAGDVLVIATVMGASECPN